MKLELGAGFRPTRDYEHHDAFPFPHIEHVGEAADLTLPDNSLDEVLALGFVEHLTYYEALDTFRNVHRMLKPGAKFLFDVPDFPVWARYYCDAMAGFETPKTLEQIRKTLFGWQRWPGDEHKWGWDRDSLHAALHKCGFFEVSERPAGFPKRTHRDRFTDPDDAHLYVVAVK